MFLCNCPIGPVISPTPARPAHAPLIIKTIIIIVLPLKPAYSAVFKLKPETFI